MDHSFLVANGYRLLDRLDKDGMNPQAALWYFDDGIKAWRLWIVPRDDLTDMHKFYGQIRAALRADPEIGLVIHDVQMISATHPAMAALSRSQHVEGHSSKLISTRMLDGFFLPEGILLRMTIEKQSNAA